MCQVADLVLLVVDGAYGFEMETFEFLNMCQVHGFPRVMGVLTHLDSFTNAAALRRAKKTLKHRFWTDIYDGAKLFYLSGLKHGRYPKAEITNLARFLAVIKFRPLIWRAPHATPLAATRHAPRASPPLPRLTPHPPHASPSSPSSRPSRCPSASAPPTPHPNPTTPRRRNTHPFVLADRFEDVTEPAALARVSGVAEMGRDEDREE